MSLKSRIPVDGASRKSDHIAVGKLGFILMRTIWLPLIWVFATLFDVIYYADGKPTSAVGQFFESLVFFSNFLVYALQWQLREIAPMGRVILPAATQFLFWWIVGLLGYLAIEKIRASERELK